VAAELDAGALPMQHAYTAAMPVRRPARRKCSPVFASPLVFGEPLPWIAAFSRRLSLEAQGNGQQAARCVSKRSSP